MTKDKAGIEGDFQVSSLDNHIENGVIFNEIKNSRRGGWRGEGEIKNRGNQRWCREGSFVHSSREQDSDLGWR